VAEALLAVFALGSVAGWIIELAYRSAARRKVVNPGFLAGPYLPLYGFGAAFLYLLSLPPMPLGARIALFLAATTVLEYLTGEFFLQAFGLRLWDYRGNRLNLRGLVCPRFSAYWTVLATAFYLFLVPPLEALAARISAAPASLFWFGLFYGVVLQDAVVSFRLALRIKAAIAKIREAGKQTFEKLSASALSIDMKEFAERFRQRAAEAKSSGVLFRFLNPYSNVKSAEIEEAVREALLAVKRALRP
jgi:uncharacterized membrane protein